MVLQIFRSPLLTAGDPPELPKTQQCFFVRPESLSTTAKRSVRHEVASNTDGAILGPCSKEPPFARLRRPQDRPPTL
jgi:hypothetical protein